MKKYLLIFTVLVLSLTFNSCDQNTLDIPQRGAIDADSYYANATDANAQALIAFIYKQVYTTTGSGWISTWAGLSNDIPATAGAYSNVSISSSNHPGNAYFTFFYRVNFLCNRIIEQMKPDTDAKKIVIGEAYFWRAWVNMYLIQIYGTPPLVDHVLTPSELTPANGDRTALFNYVKTSLQAAIERLPQKASLNGQSAIGGRITKHSAYALLGKAQLWSGDYAGAIASLGTVITSNLYGLEANYSDLYHPKADFSKEYMWEWNIQDSDNGNYALETDGRTTNMNWRSENVNMPGGVGGNGFGTAAYYTKDFYDFMVARGEKGKARYMGTVWNYEEVLDKFVQLGLATNKTTALGKFWRESPIVANCQGYFRSKMYVYANEVFPFTSDKDRFSKANWPGMRYSEVLLNYAEACALSSTNATLGLNALNTVRTRAGLDPLGTLTLKDVKDEKRAELVLEGDRFLDLIRWNDAPIALANRGFFVFTFKGYASGTDTENGTPANYVVSAESVQGATNFVVGRDEHFPYPYSEKLMNSNLVQNSNWQ
jgi:hypothetical protein